MPEQVLDTAVDPTEIVTQSFDTERRGFDQQQVQQYLRAVADSLQDAQQREADMRSRLGKAVRRSEAAEKALRTAPAHDAAELNREFGDQVTSVLEAARIAGEQRGAVAEKSAAKLLANAKAEATKMRAAADAVLQERSAQAELAAVDILGDGQAEAQSIRDQARMDAEAMLAQAADRVQRARDECDGLIREAEEARAQILEDMERRRRQARAQVERLRVGRDRLLRSYEVVRRTLEETTVELKSSLKEAKVRGDGAARAITSEPLASREQLEAELRDAKMIGRITLSDPAPDAPDRIKVAGPLRSPALPRPVSAPSQQAATPSPLAAPRRPRVSEAMKKGALAAQPKAPAVAPALTASTNEAPGDPIAAMMAAAEAKQADTAAPVSADLDGVDTAIDAELAELEDANLDVVEPSDEIEKVIAVPLTKVGTSSDAKTKAPAKTSGDAKAETKTKTKTKTTAKAKTSGDAKAKTPARTSGDADPAAPGLFAALRAQRSDRKKPKSKSESKSKSKPATTTPQAPEEAPAVVAGAEAPTAPDDDRDASSTPTLIIPGIEAQRDAVIADAAKQLEKRLRRALADEQNDVLAGIRAAKKRVALTAIVGDVDTHVNRYVLAIHEVAAVTYGAGAALIDARASEGHLPAGAVEELLETDVVSPIRQRLASLDDLEVAAADMHVDPVRAFYRQRKTDHLGLAASRLANLLCVAGLCDALPEESSLPWDTTTK